MNKKKKTSVLNNTAVWLGASISAAEIMSGAFIAPIGFRKGILAIVIGHLIAGLIFYLCGRMGAETGRSSMKCVELSFGRQGAGIFAGMNVLQLVFWTAMMLHVSAKSLSVISYGVIPVWCWCILIGAGVGIWVFFGKAEIGYINLITSAMLLILTFSMLYHVVGGGFVMEPASYEFEPLDFGSAIELSVAMPMAWIPLVADYTSRADHPQLSNAVSTAVYIAGSAWMYGIGLAAALFSGQTDIIQIMVDIGAVRISLLIIVLATMTSTFLDTCSAGISAQAISSRWSVRVQAVAALGAATILSLFLTMGSLSDFLYLLASVFVPMAAIIVTDYFFLDRRETDRPLELGTMLLWAVGFVVYHLLMSIQTPVGSTIPLVILIAVVRILTQRGS